MVQQTYLYLSIVAIFMVLFFAIKPVIHQITETKIQHLVFGIAAVLSLLWWMHASIFQGLEIHLFWLTAATLILGWRWAMFSALLTHITLAAMGLVDWRYAPFYYVINAMLPIAFSYFMYMVAYHRLPRHFFVYTFFCSFFTGALSLALCMFLWAGFTAMIGLYSWQLIVDNYLLLIPLLLFPEGLLNGMAMTLLIVYKPDWVKTFYDNQYLDK